MSSNSLEINPDWGLLLSADSGLDNGTNLTQEHQCQLVFSLILYLNLSLKDFIFFLFESKIRSVRHRAGLFMSCRSSLTANFAPAKLYTLWWTHFSHCRQHLADYIIQPHAKEIVLKESDIFIADKRYKVPPKSCTVDQIMDVLDPGKLASQYEAMVPFTWDLLMTFTVSANRYRKRKARSTDATMESDEESWLDDEVNLEGLPDDLMGQSGKYWASKGFARNPTFVRAFI